MNLRELNLKLTRESLVKETSRDVLIIQTIHTIDELIKIINRLIANLRERYGYYAPRAAKEENAEKLLNIINRKIKEDIGLNLDEVDLASIIELSEEIKRLINLKESQEKYLEKITEEICPRLKKTATSLIAARLVDKAGSLKNLAKLPSSTIQVLGAEKALFRHLKTKSKAPKFGIIFAHQNISNSPQTEKGKAARRLAAEISKSTRIDYFSKDKEEV
ncbi:hypothetical protein J4216_00825 [Candidatus Woesearchaeota archaeon]|nr:hypothetical protein [Candidatus Woesearchaeota archaeon]